MRCRITLADASCRRRRRRSHVTFDDRVRFTTASALMARNSSGSIDRIAPVFHVSVLSTGILELITMGVQSALIASYNREPQHMAACAVE